MRRYTEAQLLRLGAITVLVMLVVMAAAFNLNKFPGFGGDTYLPEWREGLTRLMAMDWDRMIPGHGARLGNKADVQLLIDYMTDADAQAKGLAEAGRCNADGRAAVAIPAKYQGYAQPAQWSAALDRYCTFHNQGY